jgi:hypothetical protein
MTQSDFRALFGGPKAMIGMVHLPALPGAPGYRGDFEHVYRAAAADLEALEKGGASAALVENFWDTPYQSTADEMTVSSMAILVDRLGRNASIPLGINVQFNCTDAEWDVAYLTGSSFIRVEAFTENRIGAHGVSWAAAAALMRRKARYPADILIFADVDVKHTFPLVEQPLCYTGHEALEYGADALILTGTQTGSAPAAGQLEELRETAGDTPVLIGSGISEGNIANYLAVADGVIVGSSVKKDGRVESPVDIERVRRLAACVRAWE